MLPKVLTKMYNISLHIKTSGNTCISCHHHPLCKSGETCLFRLCTVKDLDSVAKNTSCNIPLQRHLDSWQLHSVASRLRYSLGDLQWISKEYWGRHWAFAGLWKVSLWLNVLLIKCHQNQQNTAAVSTPKTSDPRRSVPRRCYLPLQPSKQQNLSKRTAWLPSNPAPGCCHRWLCFSSSLSDVSGRHDSWG